MSDRTLTVRQAALQLGVRLDTIYMLLWAGQLSAEKRDGIWQIPAEAVQERKQLKRGRSWPASAVSEGARRA